jgi:hypothetical protein
MADVSDRWPHRTRSALAMAQMTSTT